LLCAVVLGGYVGAARGAAAAEPTPSPSSSIDQAGSVKYYVVGHTGTGEREYLFQIAAWTLGDGRRYLEIFDLNEGRLQPDGGRLDDPLVLMPGWILILPPDADGPGVFFGPPPIFGSAQASAPSTDATTSGWPGEGMVRAVALVVVTVVLGVALHLLRRGRRIELPAPARAALRKGIERLPTPVRGDTLRARPSDDGVATSPTARLPVVEPVVDDRIADVPIVDDHSVGVAIVDDPEPGDGAEHRYGHSLAAVDQAPAMPADPMATRVETSLRAGRDIVTVRLIGTRPDSSAGIVGRGLAGPPRTGGAIVRLGEAGPDALWVDLAASPDVVRITGDHEGVRRQAEDMARQLARTGVPTVVVGDVPGVSALASRSVSSLRELADGSDPAQLLVVFLEELPSTEPALLHELVARRRPRVVPVAIGSGPRSRWWMDVT
jgi:hypothetical protein